MLQYIKISVNIHLLFPIDIFVSFKQDSNDVSDWTNNKKPVDAKDTVDAHDLKK